MRARFIDIHVLQTVPYANLNRDDLGSPKSVTYGGVQRTRVSSQCWKRFTRLDMEAALADTPGFDQPIRTRRPVAALIEELTALRWSAEDARHVAGVIFAAYLPEGAATAEAPEEDTEPEDTSSEAESNVLLFLTRSQYRDLAALADRHMDAMLAATPQKDVKKEPREFKPVRSEITEIIKNPRGLIALFGRMIAALPEANVDASSQVAHSFTVHASAPEFDYFTAVDDLLGPDTRGAGHLGTAEFSTGTFYRYATVDLDSLHEALGDPALVQALTAQFLTSFARSLPSGKTNGTAPHTRPGFIAITVRGDQPLSYATAFEQPVTQSGTGYLLPALTRLTEHAHLIEQAYGDTPLWSGHLNAATTDNKIRADLAAVFGDPSDGGLTGLTTAAVTAAVNSSSLEPAA